MITFLISNVNALKAQRGATLIHMKYTREPLKYRKRTKFQKLKKKKKKFETSKLFHATLHV